MRNSDDVNAHALEERDDRPASTSARLEALPVGSKRPPSPAESAAKRARDDEEDAWSGRPRGDFDIYVIVDI